MKFKDHTIGAPYTTYEVTLFDPADDEGSLVFWYRSANLMRAVERCERLSACGLSPLLSAQGAGDDNARMVAIWP